MKLAATLALCSCCVGVEGSRECQHTIPGDVVEEGGVWQNVKKTVDNGQEGICQFMLVCIVTFC